MTHPAAVVQRSLYLLADTSGSTTRGGFSGGWHLALPRLVALAESLGPGHRISLLTYGDDASLRVPLTGASQLAMIPLMPPAGLSSLAAGLRLLARVVRQDRQQLRSDGIADAKVALIVADGLPTDADEVLLEARAGLDPHAVGLHLVAPPGEDREDRLALAALRATLYPLRTGDAGRIADSIVAAAGAALTGSGGPQ
ncbi:vWA domain-containing protein [Dactylosporangium sp. NPDC049140]|uniref:vWA domain-containing protein n=1 Tax=Dactylosporangium sp. NPDC049140 TaxID=3155647 RepID=UPI0033D43DC0